MKVLIADDNVAVQEIIRNIFAERGHNVRTASMVDEAVEKIRSFKLDVLILDSWIYNEDGVHVVSRTRGGTAELRPQSDPDQVVG